MSYVGIEPFWSLAVETIKNHTSDFMTGFFNLPPECFALNTTLTSGDLVRFDVDFNDDSSELMMCSCSLPRSTDYIIIDCDKPGPFFGACCKNGKWFAGSYKRDIYFPEYVVSRNSIDLRGAQRLLAVESLTF